MNPDRRLSLQKAHRVRHTVTGRDAQTQMLVLHPLALRTVRAQRNPIHLRRQRPKITDPIIFWLLNYPVKVHIKGLPNFLASSLLANIFLGRIKPLISNRLPAGVNLALSKGVPGSDLHVVAGIGR